MPASCLWLEAEEQRLLKLVGGKSDNREIRTELKCHGIFFMFQTSMLTTCVSTYL